MLSNSKAEFSDRNVHLKLENVHQKLRSLFYNNASSGPWTKCASIGPLNNTDIQKPTIRYKQLSWPDHDL